MNKANEHSHKFYDHEYQIVTWDEFHNHHRAGGFGITDEHLECAHEIAKSLPESEKPSVIGVFTSCWNDRGSS